jgi:hypothetical protein
VGVRIKQGTAFFEDREEISKAELMRLLCDHVNNTLGDISFATTEMLRDLLEEKLEMLGANVKVISVSVDPFHIELGPKEVATLKPLMGWRG